MQIKTKYYDWPTAYLWLVSYVSSPISNMCWILRDYPYDHPTAGFLYSLLPGFWEPKATDFDLGSHNIVDGVHTYIAKYYLDWWFLGIAGYNYLWGLISGWLTLKDRITRLYLVSAVLLSCIGFMFFSDFLTILIIVIEIAALAYGQRYFEVACP